MTERLDMNRMLMEMKSLQADMRNVAGTPISSPADAGTKQADFSGMLKSAVDTVNETQMQASNLAGQFEVGAPGVDLPEVMVALQKANVSFQAMTQVRNRLVQAYQDIMNMPI